MVDPQDIPQGDQERLKTIAGLDFSMPNASPHTVTLRDLDRELNKAENVTVIRSGGQETINFSDRTELSLVFSDTSGDESSTLWRELRDMSNSTLRSTNVAFVNQDPEDMFPPAFVIRDVDVPDALDPAEFGYDVPSRDEIG